MMRNPRWSLARQADETPRQKQMRRFRCYQVFGVLLMAGAILLAALLRTNPRWIFTPGWWRP